MRVIPLYFVFAFLCNCILNENLNLTEILIFICICFYIAVQQSWVWDEWWGWDEGPLYFVFALVCISILIKVTICICICNCIAFQQSWVWVEWWGSLPGILYFYSYALFEILICICIYIAARKILSVRWLMRVIPSLSLLTSHHVASISPKIYQSSRKRISFFMQFWFWFSNLIGVTYSYISQLTAHHFDPLLNFLMLESIFLPLTVNLSFLFKLWDWNQLHIDSRVIRYHWPTLNKQSLIIFILKKTCTIFVTVAVNFKILKNKQVRLCAWLWRITVLPRYVHWKNEEQTKLLAFRIPRSFLTVASPKSELFMLFVCNLRKKYLYK